MSDAAVCSTAHIDQVSAAALAAGALQPIDTEQVVITDAGLPFVIKWVSSLLAKPRRHKPAGSPAHNPFLPPESALTLGALTPEHLLVLNKYPVMSRHLLVITRHFQAQTDPLSSGDFAALGQLISANGGLGFYNGGGIAGASQAHKHLQWIPDLPPLARQLPAVLANPPAPFAFRHAFASLAPEAVASDGACASRGERRAACFRTRGADLGIDAMHAPLPPYNLLLTRGWMWLIPRRAERWRDMSINALGFAGSLFIKSRDRFAAFESAGPLAALNAVTLPAAADGHADDTPP